MNAIYNLIIYNVHFIWQFKQFSTANNCQLATLRFGRDSA